MESLSLKGEWDMDYFPISFFHSWNVPKSGFTFNYKKKKKCGSVSSHSRWTEQETTSNNPAIGTTRRVVPRRFSKDADVYQCW